MKATQGLKVFPPTIVIDSNEGAPFQFRDITENKVPLVVRTIRKPMWVDGLADYSLEGFERQVQVERKSIDDLFGTLGQRRDRFQAEIARLHDTCDFAAVVVEADEFAIRCWQGHGPHPVSVLGTIHAWQQRYHKVHWLLCRSRATAEVNTFQVLKRFWLDWKEREQIKDRNECRQQQQSSRQGS